MPRVRRKVFEAKLCVAESNRRAVHEVVMLKPKSQGKSWDAGDAGSMSHQLQKSAQEEQHVLQ